MRTSVLAVLFLASACGKSSSKDPAPAKDPAPGSAVASGSAVVTPPAAPAVTGDFATHLAAGKKAEAAKDWKTAITELDAAVALEPDDAQTLAELTWVAYFGKQLDHARDVGVRAVLAARAAKLPKLEAMALYNLGLAISDADLHAARSLYKASLDLRPNKTVHKSLEDADESKEATPAGDALLAKVNVTRVEENRKTPENPADAKLFAALADVGSNWNMGAGHGSMRIDIDCVIADTKCTFVDQSSSNPPMEPATGDKAKAVIAALQGEGIKSNSPKLSAHIDCYLQDMGYPDGLTPADSCDVTKR